jgi:hypothetical protein
MKNLKHYICYATLIGLAAVTGAYAQVSTINKAVTTHLYNDITNAVVNSINAYPASIFFSETGVTRTNTSPPGLNRDVWQFSNNGTTAYQFQSNNYFNASFNLTLTGSPISPRKEAGFLFTTASSGDIQFIVNTDGHEVVQFGGISFYSFNVNNGITYNSGNTINLGMSYFQTTGGTNALRFWANGVASPIFTFAGGASIGNGSTLGGYFQIQNDPLNPGNMGDALFSSISITPIPEPSMFALLALGILPLVFRRRR